MRSAFLCCLAFLALVACTAPRQQASAPPPKPCVENGVASWYAPHPGQTRMADGKPLNPNALTAAHRSLPFGTMVHVTNLDTGRSTVVRITDRGPNTPSRILDVSPAAARELAMKHDGVAHVRLEIDGGDGAGCPLTEMAKS